MGCDVAGRPRLTDVHRSDIWLVDLGEPVGHEQGGRRPGVVVSNDIQNAGPSGIVTIVPVTRTRRSIPTHIELDPDLTGLDELSYATCEHVKSVSTDRLIARLGKVGVGATFAIGRALRILLDV